MPSFGIWFIFVIFTLLFRVNYLVKLENKLYVFSANVCVP